MELMNFVRTSRRKVRRRIPKRNDKLNQKPTCLRHPIKHRRLLISFSSIQTWIFTSTVLTHTHKNPTRCLKEPLQSPPQRTAKCLRALKQRAREGKHFGRCC